MVELTIVERQKGDQSWAELLTRIRVNEHTEKDEATLKTRLLSELKLDPTSPAIRDLPHLFHTNADVDAFNEAKLNALVKDKEAQLTREGLDPSSSSLHLVAHDEFDGQSSMKKDKYKGDFSKLIPKSRNETGGLHSQLRLCLGARVMLKRNIDVEDGLVNGSMGKLVGWHRNTRDGLPLCIYIQFDKVNGKLVGRKARKELAKYLMGDMPISYVPLRPSTVTFKGANRSRFTIRRDMFALCLAWALTVHSCQGMTLERAVLDLGSSCIPCAVAYVGLSRVVSMEGLFLLRFHPNGIRCDERALKEMARLRAFSSKGVSEVAIGTEDSDRAKEQANSGDTPAITEQNGIGKKKAKATLEKLAAAVKDAGKSLGRSMRVLPSLANSGFESLGPQVTEAGRWVVATFVTSSASPCSFEHFVEHRVPAMRAAIAPNADVLNFLLRSLRRLAVLRLDQLPRGVKRDRALGDVLYQCLSKTYIYLCSIFSTLCSIFCAVFLSIL